MVTVEPSLPRIFSSQPSRWRSPVTAEHLAFFTLATLLRLKQARACGCITFAIQESCCSSANIRQFQGGHSAGRNSVHCLSSWYLLSIIPTTGLEAVQAVRIVPAITVGAEATITFAEAAVTGRYGRPLRQFP